MADSATSNSRRRQGFEGTFESTFEGTFEGALRFEAYALEHLYRTHDHAEAVKAFREKRPPDFQGR